MTSNDNAPRDAVAEARALLAQYDAQYSVRVKVGAEALAGYSMTIGADLHLRQFVAALRALADELDALRARVARAEDYAAEVGEIARQWNEEVLSAVENGRDTLLVNLGGHKYNVVVDPDAPPHTFELRSSSGRVVVYNLADDAPATPPRVAGA